MVVLGPDDPGTTGIDEANERRLDFSFTGTGSLGDTVWFDQDADGAADPPGSGVFDGQDEALAGVDLIVTWAGFDGIAGNDDDLEFGVTTDSSGEWRLGNLPLGDYLVRVDVASLPPGIDIPTFDDDGIGSANTSSATLTTSATDDLDQDFSYTGGASLGDTVWYDRDGDGLLDPDEVPLGDVDVTLTYPGPGGSTVTVTTTTMTTAPTGSPTCRSTRR